MVTLVYRSAEIYAMSTGSSFNRYSFKIKSRNIVAMLYGVFGVEGRWLAIPVLEPVFHAVIFWPAAVAWGVLRVGGGGALFIFHGQRRRQRFPDDGGAASTNCYRHISWHGGTKIISPLHAYWIDLHALRPPTIYVGLAFKS